MLQDIKFSKYRFVLEAGEKGLELPPFKSSAFRGGFGHVFKQLTCAFPGKACSECSIQNTCPYIYIFETKPPVDSKKLSKNENVPRPYIIATEFEGKQYFRPGELLSFELFIFGDALPYVPFFVHAFEVLGSVGIGKERRPYILHRVEVIDVQSGSAFLIYDAKSKRIRHKEVLVTGKELLERSSKISEDTVTVSFTTPLRIKWKGHYTATPEFHLLIRNVVRRVSTLLYFHHGGKDLQLNYSELFQKAEQIEMIDSRVRWVDWERYSAKQGTRMALGGILGEATYRGDLKEFIPWLLFAEAIRMGKSTAFGLGATHLTWGA
ncbi:hypothetical protein CBW65_11265 [Tumebacillus avium]|uniref:CRISPR-associated protein Cas6 C-terminal domain-containing protein n=1 Tax=Tumebacillus avium TaxID=1903704 RepID=A0A1Y0IQ79_9BACL|nr:CRISPR system precrRNA processing endoribonuclease RAMP protein Cas6 [Tumebacillus avium]ARU61523.1 hypothetical protein CBW65_11265 [Tumebacillus avium]